MTHQLYRRSSEAAGSKFFGSSATLPAHLAMRWMIDSLIVSCSPVQRHDCTLVAKVSMLMALHVNAATMYLMLRHLPRLRKAHRWTVHLSLQHPPSCPFCTPRRWIV